MKGIIFDMDGILVDEMSFHAEAMRIAINEETGYDIDKRIVYLLEGMPGPVNEPNSFSSLILLISIQLKNLYLLLYHRLGHNFFKVICSV